MANTMHPIKAQLKANSSLNGKEFTSAVGKLERRMKRLYGAISWEDLLGEFGMESMVAELVANVKESQAEKYNTFNRRVYNDLPK